MLNFLLALVLHEIDHLNKETHGYPRFIDVIKLGKCRSERWLHSYILFSLIFSILLSFPTEKKVTFFIIMKFAIAFGSLQLCLWGIVFHRIIKQRKGDLK
jgi:hypothetical protein